MHEKKQTMKYFSIPSKSILKFELVYFLDLKTGGVVLQLTRIGETRMGYGDGREITEKQKESERAFFF